MILRSLYNRYQASDHNKKRPIGFDFERIPFIIIVDKDGNYQRIEEDSLDMPATFLVPKIPNRTSNAAKMPGLFWDNAKHVLGINDNGKYDEQSESLLNFIKAAKDLSERYPHNAGFKAVIKFYEKEEHLKLIGDTEALNKISKSFIGFRLASEEDPSNLIANQEDLKEYLHEHYYDQISISKKEAICLVTGRKGNITQTHSKIALGGGTSLVSFQVRQGLDSYGKSQGANAPVSPEASEAYTYALNDLLGRGKNTNFYISGTTYVFWSSDAENTQFVDSFRTSTFGAQASSNDDLDEETREEIESQKCEEILSALRAITGEKNAYIDTDSRERFFILALEPVKGRAAVKLFIEAPIEEIAANILQHLEDMKIFGDYAKSEEDEPVIRSLFTLISSAMPSVLKSEKWPKRPIEAMVRSITTGAPYPTDLYTSCIQRIKADRSVSETRAAFIKAYLNRHFRFKHHTTQNTITMALDKKQTNKGYLAGRLFAVLERIQGAANEKVTITDSYFETAATTPAYIFPRLQYLSMHHLSKISKKEGGRLDIFYSKQIQEIMELFEGDTSPFPDKFSLEDQGFFVMGYYHQKKYLYMTKEEKGVFDNSDNN